MSYYPIQLDKVRTFKYGMKAIDLIEKKFKKPISKIEGLQNGELTMNEYAIMIWAGLLHEDKDLTPEKVMELVDKYSKFGKVAKIMWEAFNNEFVDEDAEQEINEESLEEVKSDEVKND